LKILIDFNPFSFTESQI